MNIHSNKCGENLEWRYDEDTQQLTISGTGVMDAFTVEDDPTGEGFDYDDRPWSWLGSAIIKKVVIEDGIFNISNKAFLNFTSIEEVIVKGVAIRIGAEAFAGCENLKKVVFEKPDVENAFAKLENSAFGKCKSLNKINLPKNVIIEEDAFYGCDSLDTTFLSKGCQK